MTRTHSVFGSLAICTLGGLAQIVHAQEVCFDLGRFESATPEEEARLGISMDVDGDSLVTGAIGATVGGIPDAGAALVFERGVSGDWLEVARLDAGAQAASNSLFGVDVAICGERIVVGAPLDARFGFNRGAVYVFELVAGIWTEVQVLAPPASPTRPRFGTSVALDADQILVGAPIFLVAFPGTIPGAVVVFDRSPGFWDMTQILTVSSATNMGHQLALEGDRLIVSSLQMSNAQHYERTAGNWSLSGTLSLGSALDSHGDLVAIGSPASVYMGLGGTRFVRGGRVTIYREGSSGLEFEQTLAPSFEAENDQFGTAIQLGDDWMAITATGSSIGSPGAGLVAYFEESGGVWSERGLLAVAAGAAGESLGRSIVEDGSELLVASQYDGSALDGGAVYRFPRLGRFTPYGAGASASGTIPLLSGAGCGVAGTEAGVVVENGPASAAGLIAIGVNPAATPLFGGILLVGPPLIRWVPSQLDVAGNALHTFGLPESTSGEFVHLQAGYVDGLGVSLSNGIELAIR